MDKREQTPDLELQSRQLNTMINELSLFTRKTWLEWMPEVSTMLGLTGERFMVLFELNMQPDQSLKELSGRLMVSPPSLSVMINSMVDQGTVTRVPDSRDRRKVVLRISDEGMAQFLRMEKEMEERFQDYLRKLPTEDQKQLGEATALMLDVMARILNRGVPSDGRQQSIEKSGGKE